MKTLLAIGLAAALCFALSPIIASAEQKSAIEECREIAAEGLHPSCFGICVAYKDACEKQEMTEEEKIACEVLWARFIERCGEQGPCVTPGAPYWTRAAGVRYKGYNTGGEIFLGPMTSGSATPRVEANYNEFGSVGQKTYQITFSFDQSENAISTSISSPDANLTFDFDVSGTPGCASTGWDAMEIVVRDSRTDSGAALQNVMLDGFDLGDFGTVDKAGTPGWQNWTVTCFDFSQSFTVTADLVVDGYNGNESIKVEFNVGCLTP